MANMPQLTAILEFPEALATPESLPYLRAKKEKSGHLLTLRTIERNALD
jgi:hypothetical protein